MTLTAREPVNPTPASRLSQARLDATAGLANWRIWTFLGWRDVANRYQRSLIGPLWLTITTSIFLGAVGIVYSKLFDQDISSYLPYLAAGFITWLFFTSLLLESSAAFTSSIHFALNLPGPKSIYVYRVILRNIIVLGHNIPVWIAIVLIFDVPVSWNTLYVLPGIIVATLTLGFCGAFLGVISAKIRDVPVILGSLLQVVFFVTPIMWEPTLLGENSRLILLLNPFVPLLTIVRDPLLGNPPNLNAWLGSFLIMGASVIIGSAAYVRYRHRLAFWL